MRIPFLNMAMGTANRLNHTRPHAVRRKVRPARTPVIRRAKAERMPLHSAATSISRPGSENLKPSLNTGTPASFSRTYVTSAEPFCRTELMLSSRWAGIGTTNKRRPKANMAARNASVP